MAFKVFGAGIFELRWWCGCCPHHHRNHEQPV